MYDNQLGSLNNESAESGTFSLPSFEELTELAEKDPTEFEALRERLCSQIIDSAPDYLQKRLKGLQFTVDMERRRSRSIYQTCLRISQMMNASLAELSSALNNPDDYKRDEYSEPCEVVSLFPMMTEST